MTAPAVLEGQVALVTGAGSGIGAATARRLAESGAAVAVNDRRAERAAEVARSMGRDGHRCISAPGDVADPTDRAAVVEQVVGSLGGLDVLVNNAGIALRCPLEQIDAGRWTRVLDVNVSGPFFLVQTALPHLAASTKGVVVNVGSTAIVGYAGQSAYDTSKGALLAMSRSLAAELGPRGIRVNAICPGAIDTPMTAGTETQRSFAAWSEDLPLGRVGTPAEVANVIAWLASTDASYMTGATVFVDGGWLRGTPTY